MNPRSEVISNYASLGNDQSLSGEMCPACGGGRTKERSLSVWRTGLTLGWKCHRSSCGFGGGTGVLVPSGPTVVVPQKKVLMWNEEPLSEEHSTFLEERYGISRALSSRWGLRSTKSVSSSPKGRIAIPCFDFNRSIKGYVLRAVDPLEPVKAVTTTSGLSPAWFLKPWSKSVVVVEDCWSAIRASEHCSAVALLGAHLSSDNISELVESNIPNKYIGLDKDAFNRSIEFVYKYHSKVKLNPLNLPKDLKDLSSEELSEFFKENISDDG